MSATLISVVITAGADMLTLVLSVCMSFFVAGTRWGRVETDIKTMADRLAKIEGMFTLRLKDGSGD